MRLRSAAGRRPRCTQWDVLTPDVSIVRTSEARGACCAVRCVQGQMAKRLARALGEACARGTHKTINCPDAPRRLGPGCVAAPHARKLEYHSPWVGALAPAIAHYGHINAFAAAGVRECGVAGEPARSKRMQTITALVSSRAFSGSYTCPPSCRPASSATRFASLAPASRRARGTRRGTYSA